MVQTVVNIFQAFGKSGTYADDSPRRDTTYALQSGSTAAIAAFGSISFAANLSANDTVTIGETTLTAVAADAGDDEFVVGANLAATVANIAAVAVTGVTLAATATGVIVAATTAGAAGNDIALASSVSSATIVAMHGGIDAGALSPVLARFYTLDSEGKCIMGGSGSNLQLGVAMNNGMASIATVEATLTVPAGTVADVCSFGHIFIKSKTSFEIGYKAAYDTTTGEISAYTGDSAPAGTATIEGAEFIQVSGSAGEVGILSLNGK